MPDDYFYVNGRQGVLVHLSDHNWHLCLATAKSVLLRQKIVRKCREDIYHFLNHENGQIAIYDAVNPLASGRRSLAKEFAKHDIEVSQNWSFEYLYNRLIIDVLFYQTLFIESWCDDEHIIEENVRRVKISSPDVSLTYILAFKEKSNNHGQYVSWKSEDAVKHYLNRISSRIPQFQTMEEKDLNYIKVRVIGFVALPLLTKYRWSMPARDWLSTIEALATFLTV